MSCSTCGDGRVALASDHAGYELKEIIKGLKQVKKPYAKTEEIGLVLISPEKSAPM